MSKIEVDEITQQSGTTLTVGGGACKTATVDATTVTLGRSGGTVTLASGASQSGFGRTGTVDWQTGSVKTATFTAANGEGYFCNTSGGAFTVNLPAGTAGSIVSVQDYNNSFDSNTLTVQVNGSQKINGGTASGRIELDTEGEGLTLVYVDDTVGWRSIHNSNFADTSTNAVFVAASGGNATVTCGNFKTHIFTGPGTFTVSCAGNACGSNTVEYLVVAGGGGGGEGQPADSAGGGGAGGFRLRTSLSPASPLNAPANLPVSAQGYPITVGSGGAGTTTEAPGSDGVNSVFSTITATGGGGGNFGPGARPGGSGGGSHQKAGGSGNTPPVSPPQGNPGGSSGPNPDGSAPQTPNGGGGGGASAAGSGGVTSNGGPGGAGSFIPTGFVGPTAPSYGETGPAGRYFAGGGAGGTSPTRGGQGTGSGGLGGGGDSTLTGTENTGGGGGGSDMSAPGGRNGGSGIVMIRYRFQ